MLKAGIVSISLFVAAISGALAQGQSVVDSEVPILSDAEITRQETCLAIISGFPDENTAVRYQFFKLVDTLSADASSEFVDALDYFGEGQVSADTPLQDVVEGMANPVIRQAMPSATVSQFAYLFGFAETCENFITGQLESLKAYDEDLAHYEFNKVISEDALFLRQILLDALFRLRADEHTVFGPIIQQEAVALVRSRDQIEYASFDSSVSEIEALYMDDLDGRLAKINDVINGEMDREILASSVEMAKDMSEESRKANRASVWRILCPTGCEITF